MAAIWKAVVCRVYNADHWQLAEGWDTVRRVRRIQDASRRCRWQGLRTAHSHCGVWSGHHGVAAGCHAVREYQDPTVGFPCGPSASEFPNVYRIDDRKSPNPRMRGFLHGSGIIAREQGIRGFFKGFVPTTARQAANSAVRFSSYTTLKQFAESYVAPGEKLGIMSTFGLGGCAGLITV
jgi:hypothetical protein